MQIHPSLFLIRHQKTQNFISSYPREIFEMLAIKLCKGHKDPAKQLSLLSQVSWQWHQNSLHIDTVMGLLNSGALGLYQSRIFKPICHFIEVIHKVRSIENFLHIQRPISEPLPFLENQNYIGKNLTTLSSNELLCLQDLDTSTHAMILNGIQHLITFDYIIPKEELLLLTQVTCLSMRHTLNFTFTSPILRQLSDLAIYSSTGNDLPAILPDNFPNLKRLYVSIKANRLTSNNCISHKSQAPRSLESIYLAFFMPPLNFFQLSENLISLTLKKIRRIRAELFPKFPRLEKLTILVSRAYEIVTSLDFDMPQLKSLHLRFPKGFSNEKYFKKFSLNSTALQTLYLNCPDLETYSFSTSKLKSALIAQPEWIEKQLKEELPKSVFY